MSEPLPALQFPDHWKIFQHVHTEGPDIIRRRLESEKPRILIADDERLSREALAYRLDQAGYRVVVTRDGDGALAELRKPDAPLVAILDWLMPGMDGPSICKRMREADKAVYIILLTSRTRNEDIVEGLESGADDYLVKPFQTEELLARIKVGFRIIGMQRALTEKVAHLEAPHPSSSELLDASVV